MSTSVHDKKRLASGGFTLAEILIAIAIFALLVSIIMGSFSGVFSQTENLALQRANMEMARSCFRRLSIDLGNIYVAKAPFFKARDTLDEPSIYRFWAAAASDAGDSGVLLQFASRAHIDFSGQGAQGIAVIRYYLEPVATRSVPTFRLRRSDALVYGDELPETKSDPILCENIVKVQFACLDADGESHEEWDSSSEDQSFATPRAIEIRLELFSPEGPMRYETMMVLPLWRPASGKV